MSLLIDISEAAFRDGAKAERERILKMMRDPSAATVDDICMAGRNLGGPMPYSVTRKVIAAIADAIEAAST